MMDVSDTISETAFQYGRAVYIREGYAHDARYSSRFDEWDIRCLHLWNALIAFDAYEDTDHSRLKPKYREHYLRGLEGG